MSMFNSIYPNTLTGRLKSLLGPSEAAGVRLKWGLCLIVAILVSLNTHETRASPVALHHELAVTLHPEKQVLKGIDVLQVRTEDTSQLSCTLSPQAQVTEVLLGGMAAPFSFKYGRLRITMPEKMRNAETTLSICYEAPFRDPVPADPLYTEDPGYGVAGIISPRGTFLLAGSGWYPELPGSRPTFRLQVQAPEGVEAVTEGKRLRRETSQGQTTSVWEVTHPVGGLALSAGRYAVTQRHVDGIPIYTYFYPANDHLSEAYLNATARYVNLYSKLLGPYPFEKFAVVENFFPTGYGFPSYTLLGSAVIRLPFIVETSLGHEVAHSWWGNGVLVDFTSGNWSEGLTTYLADHLYKEMASPKQARRYRLGILRDYATLVPPQKDFPLSRFTTRQSASSRVVGYGKAAMVFHMVRDLIGDEAFWQALRELFREKRFQQASWSEFAMVFGRAGGCDLNEFFRQWVSRPGAPSLALSGVAASRDSRGWKVTGRLVQKPPYYDLQVPMRVETAGKPIEATIHVPAGKRAFTLRSDAVPRRLLVDPEVNLFRRLDPTEIPPSINSIRATTSLVAVASRGLSDPMLSASKLLLEALGQKEAPLIPEDEALTHRLRGHDVLFLGMPNQKAFSVALPKELSASVNRFSVLDETYDAPGDVLFAVLPDPEGGSRRLALFLPLSDEFVAAAARKIAHYGKYSYLVFRNGVNQAKGIWPVTESPLIHDFIAEEVIP